MRPLSLLPLGLLTIGAWAALAASGDLTGAGIPRFALLYFAATLTYLLALWQGLSVPAPPLGSHAPEPVAVRRALWVVLAVAVGSRLVLLDVEPSLSMDSYRYLWEGRIQLAGFDPYAHAPVDQGLAGLRDDAWARINHPEVSAIYGPLLQLLFALLAALPGELLPFKLAFLLTDLALAALVLRALARTGKSSPFWALLYLWHPLPILEVAGQCHLEVVPIALLLGSVELERSGRPRAAALVLGASIAAKYMAVLLVPALLLAAPRGQRLKRLGLIALPSLLAVLPYLGASAHLTDGLLAYGRAWRFNDAGFWAFDQLLSGLGVSQAFCRHVLPAFVEVPAGFDPAEHTTWMRIPPKLAVGLLVLTVMARTSWPRGPERRVPLESAAFCAGALFLLLSPTVHPWYALWIVPFLPLRAATGARGTAGWLLLSLVLPLSYAATVAGGWEERPWVRALEYGPALLLLAVGALAPNSAERSWRANSASASLDPRGSEPQSGTRRERASHTEAPRLE